MRKCLLTISLILGTVIGSGFSTGKEIVVFFSRFGWFSFLFVAASFFLFYFGLLFLLTKGQKRLQNKKRDSVTLWLMFACSLVFSASMFAGVESCCGGVSFGIRVLLYASVLFLSFLACFKKLSFLSKINAVLIPCLLAIILAFFLFNLPNLSHISLPTQNVGLGLFGGGLFCVLYFVLNVSLPSVVIAESGKELTKKQAKLVSFVASLVLSVFIFLINLLIVCNYEVAPFAMPILALSKGVFAFLLRFVVLVGCLTTLLSDIYISSSVCKNFNLGDAITVSLCVGLPLGLSLVGFSHIVSWLYPVASLIGIFLLFQIFLQKN